MQTQEQNDMFTRVGAGTPMGELMRRYWHPIAAAAELKQNPTKAVRVLGEDLVLYKDEGGRLGLIEAACAHRRVNMLFGIPEERGLRCPYHGWLYDETGQCLEMPAETPDSTFPSRVRLKAYPVEQLGGLVFAYLGPSPAPLLPRWEPFVREGMVRSIGWLVISCNWLQIMENSMDPVHNEYLHGYFNNYILERMGVLADRGRLGQRQFTPGPDAGRHWRRGAKVTHHVKVGFTQFEHGVLKHRLMEDEDEATSPGWTVGHPVVIPNLEHGSRGRGFQIRVPIDDTHTYYLYYNEHDPLPGENTDQAPEDIPVFKVPLPGVDADGLPIWELLDDASGQDNFAWTSQGPLMERWLERLGPSDVGILMYRRLLGEQMRIVEDGGDPMNVFRDPEKNQRIVLPCDGQAPSATRPEWRYARQDLTTIGVRGKYDTVELQHAAVGGKPMPAAMPQPARDIVAASPG